jgi:hypothetical protein
VPTLQFLGDDKLNGNTWKQGKEAS